LLWGLDARKEKGEDKSEVCGENRVIEPHVLASNLVSWLRDATDPPVTNVEIKSYVAPGSTDGYVVCLIPESVHAPHQSVVKWHREFKYRQSDNFLTMDARMVRRMFFPQFVPDLQFSISPEITLQRSGGVAGPPQFVIKLTVGVRNNGKGTAKDILVVLEPTLFPSTIIEEIARPLMLGNMGEWAETNFYPKVECRAKHPLHPNVSSRITLFQWQHWGNTKDGKHVPAFEAIELDITAYAENMPMRICYGRIAIRGRVAETTIEVIE
jgi:hypothetical protein